MNNWPKKAISKPAGRGRCALQDYFDDDDEEESIIAASTVISSAQEDDYDPLDDFM
jgi:hypothetical protein